MPQSSRAEVDLTRLDKKAMSRFEGLLKTALGVEPGEQVRVARRKKAWLAAKLKEAAAPVDGPKPQRRRVFEEPGTGFLPPGSTKTC